MNRVEKQREIPDLTINSVVGKCTTSYVSPGDATLVLENSRKATNQHAFKGDTIGPQHLRQNVKPNCRYRKPDSRDWK